MISSSLVLHVVHQASAIKLLLLQAQMSLWRARDSVATGIIAPTSYLSFQVYRVEFVTFLCN